MLRHMTLVKNRRFRGKYRLHDQLLVIVNVDPRALTYHPEDGGYVSPKHRFLQDPHGVTSQKTSFLIATTVKTSHVTYH
jgi:hypothetical protein